MYDANKDIIFSNGMVCYNKNQIVEYTFKIPNDEYLNSSLSDFRLEWDSENYKVKNQYISLEKNRLSNVELLLERNGYVINKTIQDDNIITTAENLDIKPIYKLKKDYKINIGIELSKVENNKSSYYSSFLLPGLGDIKYLRGEKRSKQKGIIKIVSAGLMGLVAINEYIQYKAHHEVN